MCNDLRLGKKYEMSVKVFFFFSNGATLVNFHTNKTFIKTVRIYLFTTILCDYIRICYSINSKTVLLYKFEYVNVIFCKLLTLPSKCRVQSRFLVGRIKKLNAFHERYFDFSTSTQLSIY